jgi:hypothetical protein
MARLPDVWPKWSRGFGEPALIFEDRTRFLREGLAQIDPHKLRPILDPDELDAFRAIRPGRNGSGDLTPTSTAFLVVSYLVDVRRRAELAQKTLELAGAAHDGEGGCELSGANNLIGALIAVLTDEAIFDRALTVRASEGRCAEIIFRSDSGEFAASYFCREGDFPPTETPLYRDRVLLVPRLAFLLDYTKKMEPA